MRRSVITVFSAAGLLLGCSGINPCKDSEEELSLTAFQVDALDELDTGPDSGWEAGRDTATEPCRVACGRFADDYWVDRCSLELNADGSAALSCDHQCIGGRRPPGLRAFRRAAERAAGAEAASVPAFLRLDAELRAHGAPAALGDRCLAAARDEVRHARVVARLAGIAVPVPRIRATPPRSLAALARDNAVEGCVNETWAAAEACLQARHGPHRAAYARIAADELRHAQLAWDIEAWLTERGVARPDLRVRAAARLQARLPPARRALAARIGAGLWAG